MSTHQVVHTAHGLLYLVWLVKNSFLNIYLPASLLLSAEKFVHIFFLLHLVFVVIILLLADVQFENHYVTRPAEVAQAKPAS